MLDNLIAGLLAGIVWAVIGITGKPVGEDFDVGKVTKTLVVGLVLGVVAGFLNVKVTDASGYTTLQLLTVVVDKLAGAVKKKLVVK